MPGTIMRVEVRDGTSPRVAVLRKTSNQQHPAFSPPIDSTPPYITTGRFTYTKQLSSKHFNILLSILLSLH